MKIRIFDIVVSVLLVVVLTLQIVTMVKVFGGSEDVTTNDGNADDANVSVIHIDASYCAMRFPSKWMEHLKFEERTEDGVYSAYFKCQIGAKTGDLFAVRFISAETEDRVGTIVKDGKEVSVVLEMAELDKSAWTTEELEIVNEMRDAKDEVIESILEYKELV